MSGETALSVRSGYVRLQGCSELQSRVCHHLACTLVRCGAGVLSGVKPAALFSANFQACARACEGCRESCSCGQIADLATETILALARGLSKHGIGLVAVWRSSNRLMLLLYRERSIGSLLDDSSIRAFLLQSGFDTSCPRSVVGEFAKRLGLFTLRGRALVGERSCRYGFQQGMSLGALAACPAQSCF